MADQRLEFLGGLAENSPMYKHVDSAGWMLRSVALRYHQPFGARESAWRLRGLPPPRVQMGMVEKEAVGGEAIGGLGRKSAEHGVRSGDLANLESVLFVSREPLSSRRLAQFAGLADGTQARTLVRRLNRLYDEERSAFRVVEVAGGFQLLSRGKFSPWLRRLHGSQVEIRLSAPTMETLAVVAYRQPILRAQIEAIRGVACGEILRQLMERDLVRIAGRSNDLGRPFLYGTTRRFLQVFGLRHLDDLPRSELVQSKQTDTQDPGTAEDGRGGSRQPLPNQTVVITQTEGDSNVKIDVDSMALRDDAVAPEKATLFRAGAESLVVAYDDEEKGVDDDDLDDDDPDDDDDEDDDEDEDEDEDGDEDDDWKEVDDEDDDLEDDLEDDDEDDDDWDDDEDDDDDDDEDEEKWDDKAE